MGQIPWDSVLLKHSSIEEVHEEFKPLKYEEKMEQMTQALFELKDAVEQIYNHVQRRPNT